MSVKGKGKKKFHRKVFERIMESSILETEVAVIFFIPSLIKRISQNFGQ